MRAIPSAVFFMLALAVTGVPAIAQPPVHVIHSFSGPDGRSPVGALLLASNGAFYGATDAGGSADVGTIFSMTAGGVVTVLHSFAGGATDGAHPAGALIEGSDGNFYGTTNAGGTGNVGTVFRMTPDGLVTILHSFAGSPGDGAYPGTGVIQARDGNLYGMTPGGGYDTSVDQGGAGTMFRLSLGGVYQLLSSFGSTPVGGLVEASDGRLYGTVLHGSRSPNSPSVAGTGAVFAFDPSGAASFSTAFAGGAEGGGPTTTPIQAADGNIYGTTFGVFGPYVPWSLSTVYRVTPDGAIATLYASGSGENRWIVEGPDVSFYGTSASSVSWADAGSIFHLTASGTFTTLHTFAGGPTDGARPSGPLVRGRDGNLYGAAILGGTSNLGVIYRVMLRTTPGDLDGDVRADLPMYDASSGTWRILTSASGHTSSTTIALGGPGYAPVSADYDGDGRLDIAVYHTATGTWHVRMAASGFTGPGFFARWGGIGYLPVPGDYDGDGRTDPAVYRAATGDWYALLSSSSFMTSRAVHEGGLVGVPVPADYDGDRLTDVAVYEPATGVWRIRTSTSGYSAIVTTTLGGPGFTPVPADYDGDGRADVAVYQLAIGTWQVLKSTTSASTPWTIGWGGSGYTAAPGDYDGDGLADFGVYSADAGRWYVLQSASDYTTSFAADWGGPGDIAVASTPPRIAWTDALRASDFDGDGASDLVAYEQTTGEWRVLESSSRFTTTRVMNWGGTGYTAVPGDYDGDGTTDLAVYHPASGVWSVLTSSSGGTSTISVPWGGPGYEPVPGDYDGDLRTDIAVYAPTTATWHLLLSSSGFTDARNIMWGAPGERPVPADFDGDGLTDLGVYDASSAHWSVALAAANYSTSLSMAWGGPGYTPVPRDFDGDGSVDFAVCVPSTGAWYVLLSGRAYTSAMSVSWGEAVDTPVSADYDADGIADPASYDPATGGWSVRLSTSAHTLTLVHTLGGPAYVALPR